MGRRHPVCELILKKAIITKRVLAMKGLDGFFVETFANQVSTLLYDEFSFFIGLHELHNRKNPLLLLAD